MDFSSISNLDVLLSEQNIVYLFVKAFGMVFSLIYLIFSFIFSRQVGLLNKVLQTNLGGFLGGITFIQVPIALFLLFLSLFIL